MTNELERLQEQLAEARQRAHDLANSIAPLQLDLAMAREDLARAQADAAALLAELEAARAVVAAVRKWRMTADLVNAMNDYDEVVTP